MSTIPGGMKEVTQEEFFKALFADSRDIMPTTEHATFTNWLTKDRRVWGWSYPGWKNVGEAKRWAIKETV